MLHPRIQKCKKLVEKEKEFTLQIMDLLIEIDQHKDYLPMGYSSLFDFTTQYLGYEEGPAIRRIGSARLAAEIPQVREMIEEGALGLSQIAKAESMFRKEKRRSGKKVETKHKLEVLQSLKGKSYRESEKVLSNSFPEVKVKAVIHLQVSEELQAKLKKVRDLMSHQDPGMSYEDLISKLCDQAIKKYEPKKPVNERPTDSAVIPATGDVAGSTNAESTGDVAGNKKEKASTEGKMTSRRTRYIPAHIKSRVYHRDQGKCTYTSRAGQRCGSTHLLQYDHIQPFEHQGDHSFENLRLLCHAHHRARG